MFGRKNERQAGHAGPNMTPMVDIVMCLLIFFMLGSTFLGPELLLGGTLPAGDVSTGATREAAAMPETRVVLKLSADNAGLTSISAPLPGLREPMLIGRPDAAVDDAARKHQTSLNDSIAAALIKARQDGLSEEATLILQPIGQVQYADVIRVYDACLKARFSKISFATARQGGA